MPYNTRRKSISLPRLGIQLPVTHAARAALAANRASAAAAAAAANQSAGAPPHHHQNHARQHHGRASSSSSSSSSAAPQSHPPSSSSPSPQSPGAMNPPSKKLKRSHSPESRTPGSPDKRRPGAVKLEATPPPSPTPDRKSLDRDDDAAGSREVDLATVKDDIVEAVIVQLQTTGNRPHLVKELTSVLMQQLRIVQQSANPCAIISSRLATYMKRPCWSAASPCPLAKELETVHPRRTYFFLTTCARQPLPDPAMSPYIGRNIITPPLSSTASGSEDADEERRRELSPSPEVDLSPEFDEMDDDVPMPCTPPGSFSGRIPRVSGDVPRNHRSASPPLEKDEREFTQTAEGLQKRKMSGDLLAADPVEQLMDLDDPSRDDSLFGGEPKTLSATLPAHMVQLASPAMRPTFSLNLKRDGEGDTWAKLDSMLGWDRSPEHIELDELEGLMNEF